MASFKNANIWYWIVPNINTMCQRGGLGFLGIWDWTFWILWNLGFCYLIPWDLGFTNMLGLGFRYFTSLGFETYPFNFLGSGNLSLIGNWDLPIYWDWDLDISLPWDLGLTILISWELGICFFPLGFGILKFDSLRSEIMILMGSDPLTPSLKHKLIIQSYSHITCWFWHFEI